MYNIKKKKQKDMCILPISKLSIENLFGIFQCNNGAEIYITEDNGVTFIGLCTFGDLKRFIMDKTENEVEEFLVQKDCHYFYINEQQKAIECIKNNRKIHSVPIIDNERKLILEYYEDKYINNSIVSLEIMEQILKEAELLLLKYDKIVFLVDKEIYDVVSNKNVIGDIFVKKAIKLKEFKEFGSKVFVYDFRQNITCDLLQHIAENKGIDYNRCSYSYSRNDILAQMGLYAKVGLFESAKNLFNDVVDLNKINWLDINKVRYDKEKEYYEYFDNDREEVEEQCVFTILDFLGGVLVIDKHKKPVFSMLYTVKIKMGLRETTEAIAQDYDIVSNIVPIFEKKGIKYMILGNPNKDQDKLPVDVIKYMKEANAIPEIKKDMMKYEDSGNVLSEFENIPYIKINGYNRIGLFNGNYFRLTLNERFTVGNPKLYNNVIYLFGPCVIFGAYVKSEDTIASYLADNLRHKYYVKNCGDPMWVNAFHIREECYKTGDLVIIMAYDNIPYEEEGITVINLIDVYKNIPCLEKHIWDNLLHCNKYVTRQIAEITYKELLQIEEIKKSGESVVEFKQKKSLDVPDGLEKWFAEVGKYKLDVDGKIGSIVMNANPFTRGHRFLIEEACKQVDVLYVFVVQEEQSFFKFVDRFNMVKIGTEDLTNVVVIPSGNFIISTVTLPGYFEKENMPKAEFDATEDLEIFSQLIAPFFGITMRFAGTEPKDEFTRRYNEFMKDLLIQNGVEFCEVPRVECGGKVISASLVRKYLKEQQYGLIQDLILPQVYEYLIKIVKL